MDSIMAATQGVRRMFGELSQLSQPRAAPEDLIAELRAALEQPSTDNAAETPVSAAESASEAAPATVPATPATPAADEPDWQALHGALTGATPAPSAVPSTVAAAEPASVGENGTTAVAAPEISPHHPPEGRRATDKPGAVASGSNSGRRMDEKSAARESTIRVDTARLDLAGLRKSLRLTAYAEPLIAEALARVRPGVGGQIATFIGSLLRDGDAPPSTMLSPATRRWPARPAPRTGRRRWPGRPGPRSTPARASTAR